MPDVIADFIDRMLAADPNIRVEVADRVCYELRQVWGGQRVYISQMPAEQTTLGLRHGAVPAHRVSRATRWRRR